MNARADWGELAELDEVILARCPEDSVAGDCFDRRARLIEKIANEARLLTELEELAARNRRLEEWLQHCRRVALIESAAIDRHLRYLQRSGEPLAAAQIELLG